MPYTLLCQTSGNVFLNRIPLCHTLDIQHVIVFPAGSSDVLSHSWKDIVLSEAIRYSSPDL